MPVVIVPAMTVPSRKAADRIFQAFAERFGYQDRLPDPANPGQTIPNPETKKQFTGRTAKGMVFELVRNQEISRGEREAAESASTKAKSEISIT